MTFIPNEPTAGERVRITTIASTMRGTFTRGHEFKLIAVGPRGYSLQDDDGNELHEYGAWCGGGIERVR